VYDHTDNLVAEGHEFSGMWDGDYPDAVEAIMAEEIEANSNIGNGNTPIATEYTVLTLVDLFRSEIVKGKPDQS